MLVVYRKNDKKIIFNSGKSNIDPYGMSDLNGKITVVERIGGTFDDYGTYRLHDINESDKVDEILKYEKYITLNVKNSEVIGYTIDHESFENDRLIEEERRLMERLIPNEREVLMAEIDVKIIDISLEVNLL